MYIFFTTFRHSFYFYFHAQLFSLNVRTFTRCNFRIGQLPMKHKLTMPQCKQLWYSFYAYILFPISVDYALLVCLNWSPQPTKPANTHEND